MQREQKKKVIGDFAAHAKDTGSPRVQVAILTKRIEHLSSHLETHPKDQHSRRGLLMMVGRRRRLLNYMKAHKRSTYEQTIKELKLRK